MSPLDILNELEQRVAALERQLGDTPGVSTLQPNVLSINPDGTIGADFTGHVHAQGLDLDASTGPVPPSVDRVRWLRASDGAAVADIAVTTFNSQLTLTSEGRALGGPAEVVIDAGDIGLVVLDQANGQLSIAVDVPGHSLPIIAWDENLGAATSMFLQLLSTQKLQLALGISAAMAGIGGWNTFDIPTNTGFASYEYFYSALPASSLTVVSHAINAANTTGNQLALDVNLNAATNVTFYWVAIGR